MSRILVGASIAVGLLAANARAAEETHRFVPLPTTGMGPVSFLYTAATRVDGGETEFAVLHAQIEYVGPDQRALTGQLARYRVACDWRAYRGPLDTSYYDADGRLKSTRPAGTDLQISFYGKRAIFAPAIDRACATDAKAASPSYGSVKEALAFAATGMVEPSPSPVSAPPPPPAKRDGARPVMMVVPAAPRPLALPEFPSVGAHRFAVVARDNVKGHTLFLDWGNMKRDGDTVVALTLAVLGDETAPNAPRWRWPVLALRSTRFDCKAQTATVLGEALGDSSLSFNAQPDSALPPHTAGASPLAGATLKAACSAAPATTYDGVAEAVAFVRWPV